LGFDEKRQEESMSSFYENRNGEPGAEQRLWVSVAGVAGLMGVKSGDEVKNRG
jgi:hypothetical protein